MFVRNLKYVAIGKGDFHELHLGSWISMEPSSDWCVDFTSFPVKGENLVIKLQLIHGFESIFGEKEHLTWEACSSFFLDSSILFPLGTEPSSWGGSACGGGGDVEFGGVGEGEKKGENEKCERFHDVKWVNNKTVVSLNLWWIVKENKFNYNIEERFLV